MMLTFSDLRDALSLPPAKCRLHDSDASREHELKS